MKNLFLFSIFTILLSCSAYAQDEERTYLTNLIDELGRPRHPYFKPGKVEGSPYLSKNFVSAKVNNINALLRYDMYKDEFEFMNSTKDTLALTKTNRYPVITLLTSNTKYHFVDYYSKGNLTTGYLIWLYEKNNFTLFKKQNVVFTKERLPKTGFERPIPASFEKGKDSYYFKSGENGILDFPTSKKGLLKLYPEKKEAIESFIKQNKIDMEKETDVIKMADFLAT